MRRLCWTPLILVKFVRLGWTFMRTSLLPMQPSIPILPVSCTPHIGAGTVEAQKRIGLEIVDIIRNFTK